MSKESLVSYLGFEYEMLPGDLDPKGIMQFLEKKQKAGKEHGYIPVIVPVEDDLEDYLSEQEEEPDGPLRAEEFFLGRDEEYADADELSGEITKGDKNDTLVSMIDYESGEPAECVVLHLPTEKPWEAASLVPMGGWNECPDPLQMSVILKYWYEKYGAVPAAVTHDTLELVLPEPVPIEKAFEVAREHYLFCPDRVTQCTESGTIGELAGDLSVSKVWYFWWD